MRKFLAIVAVVVMFTSSMPQADADTNTTIPFITKESSVPSACLEALDEAQAMFRVFESYMDLMGQYPSMISEAAAAGINGDADALEDLTVRIRSMTVRIKAMADKLTSSTYGVAARRCRLAAG